MNRLRSLFLLLFFSIFYLTAFTQSKDAQPFFFIQLTDPQFGFLEDNKGFSQETRLFEKAVAEVNRLKPDFIVITGDLVNKRPDRSQVNEFRRIVGLINPKIPVYYSPGNHDLGEKPGKKESDQFRKDFGKEKFSILHKDTRLIGLNSCLIKNATPVLENEQYKWLEKQLSKSANNKHIIIFTHYSFFITDPNEAEAYFNIPLATRKKYLDLFNKYGVDAVFAGHLHNNGYGKSGKMEMVTTSAVGKQLGKAASGLRIVKVYPDRIEHKYYGLDEIPGKIF
jgi:3',5'-cyclic AMP phosphodiesterase CpdA